MLDLPPVATLADESKLSIVTEDRLTLDGRFTRPEGAHRVVVLAHPHPLYGGTMHDAIVVAIARVMTSRGVAVLRFDFRGVGRSEGRWEAGRGEVLDLLAALRAARSLMPDAPVALAGYSFGAFVALRAAALHAEGVSVERLALIAPAARLFDYTSRDVRREALDLPTVIALGDRDTFCSVSEAKSIAAHVGASLAIFPGADHSFMTVRRRLAEHIAPFLLGESDTLAAP